MSPIDSEVVHLNGYIDVPANKVDEVTKALPLHIELTLAEAGCISFEVTPSSTVAGRFDVNEYFINQTAFKAHQTRNRASDWYQVTAGLPREYTVTAGGKIVA